jgi:phosphinothricin acetyltransferase
MIRSVLTSDAAAIAEIYNYYIVNTTTSFETEPLSVDDMRQRIASISDRFPYFVWVADGRVVAYCYAHEWKERAAYSHTWETTVYIDAAYQGQGIGRKLMMALIAECRTRGAYVMVACITAENSCSIRFHQKLGFAAVSHFIGVGEKFGRRLDVVDMQYNL